MLDLRISADAAADLTDITEHTHEHFGWDQAHAYLLRLVNALDLLKLNPNLGTDCSRIKLNLRKLVHESHSIYYIVTDSEIEVHRILNQKQDPMHHLM